MGRLLILRPIAPASVGSTPAIANLSRILTPDPKEAAFLPAGSVSINFDLGSSVPFNTIFLGWTGSASWTVTTSVDGVAYADAGFQLRSDDFAPYSYSPVRHALGTRAGTVTARYVTISTTAPLPANFPIGTVALGFRIESFWGHEWGAGRPLEDTGTADRLKGGGFGIDEGVVASGYQWTFGDLTDQEMLDLFAFAKDRGTTRSALIVEDPDRTAGIHERIHWGLLDRLEAYERQGPGLTKWSLRIRDWA